MNRSISPPALRISLAAEEQNAVRDLLDRLAKAHADGDAELVEDLVKQLIAKGIASAPLVADYLVLREEAVSVVKSVAYGGIESVELGDVGESLLKVLGEIGPPALMALLDRLTEVLAVQNQGRISVLRGHLGPEAYAKWRYALLAGLKNLGYLEPLVASATEGLFDPDPARRAISSNLLSAAGDSNAVPLLASAFQRERNFLAKEAMLSALADLPGEAATSALAKVAGDRAEHTDFVGQAVMALAERLPYTDALRTVTAALAPRFAKNPNDASLHWELLRAFNEMLAKPGATGVLMTVYPDMPYPLRSPALSSIDPRHDPSAAELLSYLYGVEKNVNLKTIAFSKLCYAMPMECLRESLTLIHGEGKSPEERIRGLDGLVTLHDTGYQRGTVTQELLKSLEWAPSRSLHPILTLFQQHGDASVIPSLLRVEARVPEPEIRRICRQTIERIETRMAGQK